MYKTVESYNPLDHRQCTDRAGATWGVPRTGYNLYERHYAGYMDDVEPIEQSEPQNPIDEMLWLIKSWAYNKYGDFYINHQEDINQEINLKCWILEESGEINYTTNKWERPKYIMTALKNVIHDYAKKELQYFDTVKMAEKAKKHYSDEIYFLDHSTIFSKKTLKAALVLFVLEPKSLSIMNRDTIGSLYKNDLRYHEHKALIEVATNPNASDTAHRYLNTVASRLLPYVNRCK